MGCPQPDGAPQPLNPTTDTSVLRRDSRPRSPPIWGCVSPGDLPLPQGMGCLSSDQELLKGKGHLSPLTLGLHRIFGSLEPASLHN